MAYNISKSRDWFECCTIPLSFKENTLKCIVQKDLYFSFRKNLFFLSGNSVSFDHYICIFCSFVMHVLHLNNVGIPDHHTLCPDKHSLFYDYCNIKVIFHTLCLYISTNEVFSNYQLIQSDPHKAHLGSSRLVLHGLTYRIIYIHLHFAGEKEKIPTVKTLQISCYIHQ